MAPLLFPRMVCPSGFPSRNRGNRNPRHAYLLYLSINTPYKKGLLQKAESESESEVFEEQDRKKKKTKKRLEMRNFRKIYTGR